MNDGPEDQPWLNPDIAERLLDGEEIAAEGADPDPRIAELAGLLAAAEGTPAGRADDERAALQAFAREFKQPAPARGGAPGRGRRRTIRGSRTAKAMIGAAAAVFALGGAAIAAQTGALPHPFHSGGTTPAPGSSTATTTAPRTPASAPGKHGTHLPTSTTTTGAGRTAPATSPLLPSPSAHATGAPAAASLKGLCESYVKAARQGRKLDPPSQIRLEQAAGGASEVDAYCARLTGTTVVHGKSPAATSSASPSSAAKAPTPRPSVHGQTQARPSS